MGGYDHEPIRGLPERLPSGERLLWQGGPKRAAIARRALHGRKVVVYFALLMAWAAAAAYSDGKPTEQVVVAGLVPMVPMLGLLALIHFYAYLVARTTVYTVTSRRVVLRFGVALPRSINIPFRVIQAAAMRSFPDGTGNISLELDGSAHIAYLHMWPHARPWRFSKTQPMLRGLAAPDEVARLLGDALNAAKQDSTPKPRPRPKDEATFESPIDDDGAAAPRLDAAVH